MGQDKDNGGVVNGVKTSVSVISDVLRLAGENVDTRAAGAELGRSALTITKTINNALLPLAAVNFAFDKARDYFANRFPQEIAGKIANIPPDSVSDPKPSIAGPALQGLAFSHEEPNLKEMYLNLLATAMDRRRAGTAHPAFVEIVRQLNAEEAGLLRVVLAQEAFIPIAEIRQKQTEPVGWSILQRHVLQLQEHGRPFEDPFLPAMVDNWIRLGLVTVDYMSHVSGAGKYDWVEQRPEFDRFRAQHGNLVEYEKGVMAVTSLGQQFAVAVGIRRPLHAPMTPSPSS